MQHSYIHLNNRYAVVPSYMVSMTGVLAQESGAGYKKGTLSPPYPMARSIGSAQKYFPDFHQEVFQ